MTTYATPWGEPEKSEPEKLHTGINTNHIEVGGGPAGFVFSAGVVFIFLLGIPALRWFPLGAMAAGSFISIALRLVHRHKPVQPFPSISH